MDACRDRLGETEEGAAAAAAAPKPDRDRPLNLDRLRVNTKPDGKHFVEQQTDPGAELKVDAREGEGGLVEAEVAPHPTRGKPVTPEVFTENEVRALTAACSTRGVTGRRNRAPLAVLWRTGTVWVRLGKELKPRTDDGTLGPRRPTAGRALTRRAREAAGPICRGPPQPTATAWPRGPMAGASLRP